MNGEAERAILRGAMVAHGWTPDSARRYIQQFHDKVAAGALEDSDHAAYRKLADAVNKVTYDMDQPDEWEGDDSELETLCKFVSWLPDMIQHYDAEKIRKAWLRRHGTWTPHGLDGMAFAADLIDPFEKTSGGQWVRKSDGKPVPWPVVKD
jgi:hypothetical protein